MKVAFLERLVCPISGHSLKLIPFESEVIKDGDQIIPVVKEGILVSIDTGVWYPISNYIPVMLVFTTPLHFEFYKRNKVKILEAGNLIMPNLKCEQGENFIQKTFTEEWNLTQESDLSFLRTDKDLINLNKHVWLKWINKNQHINFLLNVGCGIGKETIALNEVTKAKEIVAVDLNFSVLQAGIRYKNFTNIEFVICSLFHMPFHKNSFDLVYSQGVIHHTFSTYCAFKKISEFVCDKGFLFIWVYALEDHLVDGGQFRNGFRKSVKHLLKNCWWWMEYCLRPWLSRAPSFIRTPVIDILSIVLHPIVKSRVIHKDKWKLINTRHSLRDVFTPAYAFRHSFNEVITWYEQNNFVIYDIQSAYAHITHFNGKKIHGIGMTGQKQKDGDLRSS